jgi:hypothetical protein
VGSMRFEDRRRAFIVFSEQTMVDKRSQPKQLLDGFSSMFKMGYYLSIIPDFGVYFCLELDF